MIRPRAALPWVVRCTPSSVKCDEARSDERRDASSMGFVTAADVRRLAEGLKKSEYGQYLLRLVDGT